MRLRHAARGGEHRSRRAIANCQQTHNVKPGIPVPAVVEFVASTAAPRS
jgi:hypothetical protein